MIDLHCHVLPGIDDGPATLEEALDLARDAHAAGIRTLAATPHVDWGHPANDSRRIARAVDELQSELDDAEIAIRVVPGGELGVTRAVDLPDDELRALTLGGGPWLLLECPLSPALATGFVAAARSLAVRGHRLLLAHPERSPALQRDPSALADLVAGGMLAQVTAGALVGRFGRAARQTALDMVAAGVIHVAASDAHGTARGPSLRDELEQAGLGPLAPWLTKEAPAAILAGRPLPPRPEAAPPGAAPQPASLTIAITMPARTAMTIATCIQIRKGDIGS